MIVNLLVLALLAFVVYITAKQEKREVEETWAKRSKVENAFDETKDFWKEVIQNPIRVVAMVVILISQRGVTGMLVSIFILFAIPFMLVIWAGRDGSLLEHINWASQKTQKWATGITVLMAVIFAFNIPKNIARHDSIIIELILGLIVLVFAYVMLSKKRK